MRRPFSIALIALLCAPLASTQTTPPPTNPAAPATTAAPVPIPTDPKQLMLLASQVNGLGSLSLKPWHLKANYQTYDTDGNPKDSGIFEEWWDGPQKYKLSYTSKNFNQVQYRSGNKVLTTGDTGLVPPPGAMIGVQFMNPMPSPGEIGAQKYDDRISKVGPVNLKCLWHDVPGGYTAFWTFCLDSQSPVLRMKAFGSLLYFFNNIVQAGGQYVAKQVVVQNGRLHYLDVDVTLLEFVPNAQDSLFAAPAGAVAAYTMVPRISGELIAGNRVSGDAAKYPAAAKNARVQGAVVLQVLISKQGDVGDLRIISGPRILQQAAYDAVKTWKYKPFLLDGKPVPVKTQLTVIFTLDRTQR